MKKILIGLLFLISVVSYGQLDTLDIVRLLNAGNGRRQGSEMIKVNTNFNKITDSLALMRSQITELYASLAAISLPIYYVSTSGSDTNSGTDSLHAWQTLAYAETNATTPGCIIALKKGNAWAIDNVLDINSGGSNGAYITWDGALWGAGANAIIQANSDGGAVPKYLSLVHIAGCDYLTMQNITFDGNDKNRWGVVIGGDNAAVGPTAQNNESYITIQDCSLTDFGTGAFYCHSIQVRTWNNDMSNITIQRNNINGVGAEAIALYNGISTSGATPSSINTAYVGYNTITNMGRSGSLGSGIILANKITGATLEHNTITVGTGMGFGIAVSSNEPTAGYFSTGVVIRYNDIRMTGACIWMQDGEAQNVSGYYNKLYSTGVASSGVIHIAASASPAWTGASLNFYNNTMVTAGTSMGGYNENTNVAGTCIFKNNLIINTAATGYGCTVFQIATSTTHTNNAYYRSEAGDLLYHLIIDPYTAVNRTGAAAWEATSVITDPLLVDRAGFDWNLQAGSPCLNTGTTIAGIPQVDFAGNPMNGIPDMGCYEKQ